MGKTNRGPAFVGVRITILGACMGWFSRKWLGPRILPHGPAQKFTHIPTYAEVDESNDSLMAKHGKLTKIFERVEEGEVPLMIGPETIFFDDQNVMYTATRTAKLLSLTDFETDQDGRTTAKTTIVKDLGGGAPLGAKFSGNTLYIADAALGLTRIQNVRDPRSKVEIVANAVVDGGKETRINLADDIAIGPKTGMVYFTDATEVYPERERDMTWDVLYSSKVEAMRGPSGRLLRYDPTSDEVTVLARDLMFANGLAVDKEESFVLYSETFYLRATKYHLAGDREGSLERVIDGHPSPAYFDGLDCAWKGESAKTSYCYIVCPSAVIPAAKLLYKIPYPLDAVLRTLVLMLPKALTPPPEKYGAVVVVDPQTNAFVELIQDPSGEDIPAIHGITVHDNKLYLGSLHNEFIGVYDLS